MSHSILYSQLETVLLSNSHAKDNLLDDKNIVVFLNQPLLSLTCFFDRFSREHNLLKTTLAKQYAQLLKGIFNHQMRKLFNCISNQRVICFSEITALQWEKSDLRDFLIISAA